MRISILGLGLMGRALARTLVKAGHSVTVWNRTEGKADGLGATSVATAAEAVEASPLVIVCVLDYAAVREVLCSVQLADRVLLNLTNGRPAEARELTEWVAARGGDYLDGGIMAVPQMIGTPGALILYSGSQPAFERYEEALGALARPRYLGADAGLAPLYDLAMLTGMYGQIAGFLEAAALIASEKGSVTEFTTELLVPWLNAMAAAQPRWAVDIEAGDYATDVSNLEVNRVGMVNLVRAFEDQGVKPDLLLPMQDVLDRRVAAGHGAQGLSSLIEELR
ncbi:NAD(P)-dependent oxidoreductase [Nonomuraea guangzhouensis]|uniref:NAD(P)-dependent oxidoreductase n=1 Tax=Nonomuraea guangzhouensis TaxID=1291555 RepID=A0ABW4G0M2_9ACTN|nr:NAD(P)-binding domain-containing protein [Nonomuraea guangzhouensis]